MEMTYAIHEIIFNCIRYAATGRFWPEDARKRKRERGNEDEKAAKKLRVENCVEEFKEEAVVEETGQSKERK